jgi:16S rRNA processing protein RimM
LLEVGRIGRAHGLKGEVAVSAISSRPERFAPGSKLFAGERELIVRSARPHQDRWLVRFVGVEDRNAAEALRNLVLEGEPLPDYPDDELWVHELVGAEVRDKAGTVFGKISEVEANPAHDLLVLDNGKLVPIVFVVDQADGVVTIDPPEGLFDL